MISLFISSKFNKHIRKLDKKLKHHKSFGKIIACEVSVLNEDLNFFGRPDIICEKGIIDIKTNCIKNSLHRSYMIQLFLYAIMTNKRNVGIYNISQGMFTYFNIPDDMFDKFYLFVNNFTNNNILSYERKIKISKKDKAEKTIVVKEFYDSDIDIKPLHLFIKK